MKLKIYHSFILATLMILGVVDLSFFGLTIYHFVTVGSKIMDGIIYVICFLLLLAFNILEIVNTFFSLKDGSRFVKFLIYDDNNEFVMGVFVVASLLGGLALAVIIYCFMIFGGAQILFSDLDRPMIYVSLSFALLVFINAITIMIFPWLGKDDKAMSIKVKKKRGAGL